MCYFICYVSVEYGPLLFGSSEIWLHGFLPVDSALFSCQVSAVRASPIGFVGRNPIGYLILDLISPAITRIGNEGKDADVDNDT